MKDSRIPWCHHTFNAWTLCTKDGAECASCYAEAWAKRTGRGWGPRAPRPRTTASYWRQLGRWDREALDAGERRRVFVGSLMDWAEGLPEQRAIIAELWDLVRECQGLDFLFLTKRPQHIAGLLPGDWNRWTNGWPNVWLLASIGDPRAKSASLNGPAILRARHLLSVRAVVHGISYEPALAALAEEIEPFLDGVGVPWRCPMCRRGTDEPAWVGFCNPASPAVCPDCSDPFVELEVDLPGISWVIYGGETGPKHRAEGTPENPKVWARDMRDACRARRVAFYHKQSAHRFPDRGIELDGQVVREYPTPRPTGLAA